MTISLVAKRLTTSSRAPPIKLSALPVSVEAHQTPRKCNMTSLREGSSREDPEVVTRPTASFLIYSVSRTDSKMRVAVVGARRRGRLTQLYRKSAILGMSSRHRPEVSAGKCTSPRTGTLLSPPIPCAKAPRRRRSQAAHFVVERRERTLDPFPVRKFAFTDGRIVIGDLMTRPEDENYHHIDLVYALLRGQDSPDFDRIVAGWIYGAGTEVVVSFGRFGEGSELVRAAARKTLREWAQRYGKSLTFEQEAQAAEGTS